MQRLRFLIAWTSIWLLPTSTTGSEVAQTQAVVEHCIADLDGDGQQDLAIQISIDTRFEVVALLRRPGGYQAHVLSRRVEKLKMHCGVGGEVRETAAGPERGARRTIVTSGAFVSLKQPEGAALTFVWEGASFREVWTAD